MGNCRAALSGGFPLAAPALEQLHTSQITKARENSQRRYRGKAPLRSRRKASHFRDLAKMIGEQMFCYKIAKKNTPDSIRAMGLGVFRRVDDTQRVPAILTIHH
uniref:Uncharacterized protein n=1 Tax=uncultured prokaryote TaxID=198431 RepID=A0A0H5Q715_9ZZZZ|nr:hypothetical protein [uncultured prokaryote]